MSLRIVGAGVGRTGTKSLKEALERLLDGPCYHMMEVFGRPDDAVTLGRAFDGELPDWATFFADYRAAVDWPACSFWRELSEAFPDAVVLLSTRDADAWWTSADKTIFESMRRAFETRDPDTAAWTDMTEKMITAFSPGWDDETTAKAAYEAHNAEVRATVPADRLLEWHPGDGWDPLCAALDVPVPDEPFPHTNTTDEFRARADLDGS